MSLRLFFGWIGAYAGAVGRTMGGPAARGTGGIIGVRVRRDDLHIGKIALIVSSIAVPVASPVERVQIVKQEGKIAGGGEH